MSINDGKKNCKVILVYLANDIGSSEKKMADGNNMNLPSFAPAWCATSKWCKDPKSRVNSENEPP
jgi:hypothetical protein